MATATSVRPTAVQTCTTSTVGATAVTLRPILEARAPTSKAVMSTVFAIIILYHATVTGTVANVITEE